MSYNTFGDEYRASGFTKPRYSLDPHLDESWPYIMLRYMGWTKVAIDRNTLWRGSVYVKDGNLHVGLLTYPLWDIAQSEDEIVAWIAALKLTIALSQ